MNFCVDEVDLETYGFSGKSFEIYLVDTIKNSYRQITNSRYFKSDPYISLSENRVYFTSNQPYHSEEPDGEDYSYYYEMDTKRIKAND